MLSRKWKIVLGCLLTLTPLILFVLAPETCNLIVCIMILALLDLWATVFGRPRITVKDALKLIGIYFVSIIVLIMLSVD